MLIFITALIIGLLVAFSSSRNQQYISPEFKVDFNLDYFLKKFIYLNIRYYDNYGDGSSEGWKNVILPNPTVMV
jgi:hypothetical protein